MHKGKKAKNIRRRKRIRQHRMSVIGISCVLMLLTIVLGVNALSLHAKNREYKAQEKELQRQLDEEQLRTEEIADLEEYVGTDEYTAEVAKDKWGLVNENEILFQAEP